MQVRRAHARDITGIVHVNEHLQRARRPAWVVDRGLILDDICHGHYVVIGDPVVAAMSFSCRGWFAQIDTLAVDTQHRARGLGAALLSYAVRSARRRGAQVLAVSSPVSYGVRGFYEQGGFSVRRIEEGHYRFSKVL